MSKLYFIDPHNATPLAVIDVPAHGMVVVQGDGLDGLRLMPRGDTKPDADGRPFTLDMQGCNAPLSRYLFDGGNVANASFSFRSLPAPLSPAGAAQTVTIDAGLAKLRLVTLT